MIVRFGALPFLAALVVLAVVGAPLVVAVIAALVMAAVVTFDVMRRAEKRVLAGVGAVAADPADHARFHSVVDHLCVTGGLTRPDLLVLDEPNPNAMVAGRNPARASLVVTSGLLDNLTRVELEAVLAHELSHIRNDEVSKMTQASLMAILPSLIPRSLPEDLVSSADWAAVAMTRDPPGLISALERLDAGSTDSRAGSTSNAHLWFASPLTTGDAFHPPLRTRIAALREV